MAHLKRQAVSTRWPIPRKGSRYLVKPGAHENEGIPLLVLLRDVLKVARTKKEVKKAIHDKNIVINTKIARDEKHGLTIFDKITIVPSKKNYKISLTLNGKFTAEEISEKEIKTKTSKIVNKTILKGKKIQFNLSDGRNVLYDKEGKTNDSVVLNLEKKTIEKILPFKEKATVVVVAGKHAGKTGAINKIDSEHSMVELETENGKINILIKQIMVTE